MDSFNLHQRLRDGGPASEEEIPNISTILEKSRINLAALDEEIARLRDRAKELEDERTSIQQNMEAHCSLLAPIRKLSNDVLYEVLLYACAIDSGSEGFLIYELPSRFVLNRLSAVCTLWQSILRSHTGSSAWSSVTLYEGSGYRYRRPLQAMKMIERSGSAPLSVHIQVRDDAPSSHSLLANEAYRWKVACLALESYPSTYRTLELNQGIRCSLLHDLSLSLRLERAYQRHNTAIPHIDLSSFCPNLRNVSLTHAACIYVTLPRTQIEELSLISPPLWEDTPLIDLDEYPRLRRLYLNGAEDASVLPEAIPCSVTELELNYGWWPRLATLILSALKPSALQKLRLKGLELSQHPMPQLPYSSLEPMLTHTRKTLVCLTMDSMFMSEEDLISVMSDLSTLEELQLLDCPIRVSVVEKLHASAGMLPNLERLTMRFKRGTELGTLSFEHLLTMAESRWRAQEWHGVLVARMRVVRLALHALPFPDGARSSLRSLKSSGINITVRDSNGFVEDIVQ